MSELAANDMWLGGSAEHALHMMAERVCASLSYRQLRVFRDAVDSQETARRADAYEGALGTARDYLWRGQPDAALNEIAEALSLDLGREEAFVLLGQTFERQGRLQPACAAYYAALQLAPLCAEARRGLGRVEDRLESRPDIGATDHAAPGPTVIRDQPSER